MYKMLVLDLDDTLLGSDGEISSVDRDALLAVQQKGIMVVLASGRPTGAMIRFSQELKLDKTDSYLISFNGGEIVSSRTGEILFEKSLAKEEIADLYAFSREMSTSIITYKGTDIISEDSDQYIDFEINLTKMNFHKVDSFVDEVQYNAVKCILLAEPSHLKRVEERMKTIYTDKSVSISKPFFLEVTAAGIDKGQTVGRLCTMLGISSEEVVAVGNAENDTSMIVFAGLGLWVENTDPELYQYGNGVVPSCDDGGVAHVVQTHFS